MIPASLSTLRARISAAFAKETEGSRSHPASWLFIVAFAALNAPFLQILDLGEGRSFKVFHAILAAMLAAVLLRWRLAIVRTHGSAATLVLSFLLYVLFSDLFMSGGHGMPWTMQFGFATAAFLVGMHAIRPVDHLTGSFGRVMWVILVLVAAKGILHPGELVRFLNWERPALPTMYDGGINLEASWLALGCAFMVNRPKAFIAYLACCLVVSIVYLSRVAIIISLGAGIAYVVLGSAGRKLKIVAFITMAAVVGVGLLISPAMIGRFSHIGAEPGSLGRLVMWRGALSAMDSAPWFGHGSGSAMALVPSLFGEDNVHNLYLQMALDHGFVGLALFVACLAILILRVDGPCRWFISLYLLSGMVEMRGTEPTFWFLCGIGCAETVVRQSMGAPATTATDVPVGGVRSFLTRHLRIARGVFTPRNQDFQRSIERKGDEQEALRK